MVKGITQIRIRFDDKKKWDILKTEVGSAQHFPISSSELLRRTLNIPNLKPFLVTDAKAKLKLGRLPIYNGKRKRR